MITATVDISKFNRGMTGFVDKLGIEAKVVLKKECGELLKSLVRVTPPREPAKTRASIDANVGGAFNSFGTEHRSFAGTDEAAGPSGIKWYAWDNKHLFGVAPDKDMRQASQSDLLSVYYRRFIRSNGRAYIEVPFKHPRKTQRVAISVKIMTGKAQVRSLAVKIKSHVGRLKAGWLASWDRLQPTGGNQPPNWVWRHKQGAHGYFIDGLGNKDFPSFAIANYSKGAGNGLNFVIQNALRIRVKAMQKNLTFFMKGKKNLSDYAQGSARN